MWLLCTLHPSLGENLMMARVWHRQDPYLYGTDRNTVFREDRAECLRVFSSLHAARPTWACTVQTPADGSRRLIMITAGTS